MNRKNLAYNRNFEETDELLREHLLLDLTYYGFISNEWEIDFSDCTDEGHDYTISGIAIKNKKSKEHFGGWSDYVATSDGQEIHVFWDTLEYDQERALKYNVKQKEYFGVPAHIQKNFSEKLRQEIMNDIHCGSRRFFKSPYLEATFREAFKRQIGYFHEAREFLHEKDYFFYCKFPDSSKFIKYETTSFCRFFGVDERGDIDEFWIFPKPEFDKYFEENKLIRITQYEFEKEAFRRQD